jgi:hypothetical protein
MCLSKHTLTVDGKGLRGSVLLPFQYVKIAAKFSSEGYWPICNICRTSYVSVLVFIVKTQLVQFLVFLLYI